MGCQNNCQNCKHKNGTTKNENSHQVRTVYTPKTKSMGDHHAEAQCSRAMQQFNWPYDHQLQFQQRVGIQPTQSQYNAPNKMKNHLQSNRKHSKKPQTQFNRSARRKRITSINADPKNYNSGGFIHTNNSTADKTNQNDQSNSNDETNQTKQPSAPPKKKRRISKFMKIPRICFCDDLTITGLIKCTMCGTRFHLSCVHLKKRLSKKFREAWQCSNCKMECIDQFHVESSCSNEEKPKTSLKSTQKAKKRKTNKSVSFRSKDDVKVVNNSASA